MKLLDGKVAIVTGGSRGIGSGIVKLFVSHGADVAFTYHSSKEDALLIEKEFANSKNIIKAYKSDASNMKDAQELVANVLNDFSGIDVLVNNAGVTKDGLIIRMSEDDFDNVVNVNMKSVFNLTKSVVPYMLKKRSGSIINMSSVVGLKGNAGQSNYSASKSAINGFTKSVALELGSRNIRCNAIAPGFIETEMTKSLGNEVVKDWQNTIPLKRGGEIVDVANTTLFLASDMSSYITGQVINVCGGMLT